MFSKIQFKTGQNNQFNTFRKTLILDLKKTKSSKNVLVFADKTANLYEISPDQYSSLLKENITKTNRKTELITKTRIDKELRKLSKPLKLDRKMKRSVEGHAFITLKGH